MEQGVQELAAQVAQLRRSVRANRAVAGAMIVGAGAIAALGLSGVIDPVQDEVRARKFVLVDDAGVVRATLHQDPKDTQRRSRSAGLTIFDTNGHERGGFATFDDASVVMAMDAPRGVGHPMPDRIGLMVDPDGASHVMLLDNMTRAVAKLHSDGNGGGGVQVFKWDMEAKEVHVKTLTFDGEQRETHPMGGG